MNSDKKLIEVLSEIVKEFIGPFGNDVEKVERKVVENLLDRGYEISEINELLEKLFKLMNIDFEKEIKIRVINPEEISNLKDDAREWLFEIKNMGIINEDDFERVLGIISSSIYKIDKNELEKILKREKLIAADILN